MTKILIEPYIDGKVHGYAIQAKKFSFDLKITNCGDSPTEEFTISKVAMSSSEGQNISEIFGHKSFFVGVINPGQSTFINISQTGQFMYGLIDVQVTIVPKDSTKIITTFQKNPFTDQHTEIRTNSWVDFLYIKSGSQDSQERSSKWVMRLTWATAFFALVQIVPILKKIYEYFFLLVKYNLSNIIPRSEH